MISISIGRLKSGVSLQYDQQLKGSRKYGDLLVLMVVLPAELLAFGGNVHPKTTLSTDGACTLDLEPDLVVWVRAGRKIDVFSSDVRSPVILQWDQIDILCLLLNRRSHAGWKQANACLVVTGCDQSRRQQ